MDFKTLLERSGKSRAQIIAEVGCSQSYLSLVESKARAVGPKYLLKMAEALGIQTVELRPDLAVLLQHVNQSGKFQGRNT